MNSINEIFASNWRARQKLLAYLEAGKAMAFIGAGASMEMYRGWGELLTFLGTEAKEFGDAIEEDVEFWKIQQSIRPQQVARMIRRKFGDEGVFLAALGKYFQDKKSEITGKDYTEAHEIIAKFPFKGIVTTNYDQGIFNALRDHRPAAAGLPATWLDEEIVRKWDSKDIFQDSKCPIMHIHGICSKAETMVLDNDSYRKVYGVKYFKDMFHSLWRQEHLVLIGCGFTDNWLERNLDELLGQNSGPSELRHIAFVGITDEYEKHVKRHRSMIQNMYRSEIYFYKIKVGKNGVPNDHSDLLAALRDIYVEITPKIEAAGWSAKPQPEQDASPGFPPFDKNL
jgi:hypothetical protein